MPWLQNSAIGGILNTSVAGALQAEIWASLGETWSAGYDWSGQVAAAEGVFQWAENLVAVPDNTIDQLSLWGPNNNYGYGNPAQAQMYVPSEIGHVVGVFMPRAFLPRPSRRRCRQPDRLRLAKAKAGGIA